MIHSHIKEMLGLKRWGSSNLRARLEEMVILRNWEICSVPECVGNIGEGDRDDNSLVIWETPPTNIFKLNFDGVSKGNTGPAGFGGAIRNSEGNMVGLCRGYIGENSNNVAELEGLLEGLDMASHHGWLPIILEGDSKIILQMATKLLHGKPMSKVANNWKMDHSLDQLRGLLMAHSEVQIHHVKRKANR